MSALFARCKLPLAPCLDVNSASNFTSASRRIATGSFEKHRTTRALEASRCLGVRLGSGSYQSKTRCFLFYTRGLLPPLALLLSKGPPDELRNYPGRR
jgi:hypothetical protein